MSPKEAWSKYMDQVYKVQSLQQDLKDAEHEMNMRHNEWKRALREAERDQT